jgi:hypothetical protein
MTVKNMKNAKIIIGLILSITIGIAATIPLISAELTIKPFVTWVQGPTAPFNIEIVYANFTITDPDAPITKTSGPTIDYNVVVNITNPSDYRAFLSMTSFSVQQEARNIGDQSPFDFLNFTARGEGGQAKGAWVDGKYYNITYTIPYPHINTNGLMTQDDLSNLTEEQIDRTYYQWTEGVQYYKYTIKEGIDTNVYTYLNMNGTWVDVTGRIIIDEVKLERGQNYIGIGTFIVNTAMYSPGGYKVTENNVLSPGESRLLVISGSTDPMFIFTVNETYMNPIEYIQSCIVQTLTIAYSAVDMDYTVENNTFIDTKTDTAKPQTLVLSQVGNSYIYNAGLSDIQLSQLNQYSFGEPSYPGFRFTSSEE